MCKVATRRYCTAQGVWLIFSNNYKLSVTFKSCKVLYCTSITYTVHQLYFNKNLRYKKPNLTLKMKINTSEKMYRWKTGIQKDVPYHVREMHIKALIRYHYTPTELVMDREAWHVAIHGVTKSQTRLSDWTELNRTHLREWPKSRTLTAPILI